MSPYERRMWLWAWNVRSRLNSKRADLERMLGAQKRYDAPPGAELPASSCSSGSSSARGTSGNDAVPASGRRLMARPPSNAGLGIAA